ncbi:Ankyrin repeat protein [Pleurostoma richardsiae]|uniref:Ankyrin repeat protein n=1 Tax=Pleurostoma richardsiae TaxID=41990 RepID=A0AA38SG12_9PEZI|nr:Ankyrin repeat protein [Pleurostoma richardsiae]
MDPLSITVSVIAVIQATNKALSICFGIRAAYAKAPSELVHLIEETKALRDILEALQFALEGILSSPRSEKTGVSDIFWTPVRKAVGDCQLVLTDLERQLEGFSAPQTLGSGTKRGVLTAALRLYFKGRELGDLLERIERCKSRLSLAITAHQSVFLLDIRKTTITWQDRLEATTTRIERMVETLTPKRTEYHEVAKWLSPYSPRESHQSAVQLHQAGTSGWLVNSSLFNEWFRGGTSLLWLNGYPGSGKTILFSHVTEFIMNSTSELDPETLVAYAYCDFRNPESCDLNNIFGSLLAQCCVALNFFPQALLDAYRASQEAGHGNGPPLDLLKACMASIVSDHKAYILVDALDESTDPASLVTPLKDLCLKHIATQAKVFVTGRNIEILEESLGSVPRLTLSNYAKDIGDDIRTYIGSRLQSDRRLQWLSSDIQNHISASLNQRSDSMFRWVQCQLDSISSLRTVKAVRKALDDLPQGLEDTYRRILSQVPRGDVPVLRHILEWLCFSVMPIKLTELYEAIGIEPGTESIDPEARLRDPQDILALGNSLFSVSDDGRIHFAHLSVRDYILSLDGRQDLSIPEFRLSSQPANQRLAEICLTYLCLKDFANGPRDTADEYVERLQQYPLLKYASVAWSYHAKATSRDSMAPELEALILKFLSPERRQSFMSWVQVLNANYDFKWNVYPRHATPLYYAASFGLTGIVQSLVSEEVDLDAPGSRFGGTAVHAAAYRSHFPALKVLLDAGADATKADFERVTPLHSAAANGDLEVMRLLLKFGAKVDAKDGMGETAYDWARGAGQMEAAELVRTQVEDRDYENMKGDNEGCSPPLGPISPEAGVPYFPDFYGNRSGLNSSVIVQIEVEGHTTPVL